MFSSKSSAKISIVGSGNSSADATDFSNDNNRAGSNIKLESIANNKVVATKLPKATVPPKLDKVNTENPKNNTTDV